MVIKLGNLKDPCHLKRSRWKSGFKTNILNLGLFLVSLLRTACAVLLDLLLEKCS